MDELKTVMNDHMDQMQEIIEKVSAELRVGMQPAVDNFIGFFHAIDWKVHLSTLIHTKFQDKTIVHNKCLFILIQPRKTL